MDKHICKAKRIDNGEWIYGYFIGISFDCGYIAIQNGNLATWKNYPVDPDTVCRCTGWQDTHKTPIFENDIVQFTCVKPERFLVWWCKEMSMMTAIPLDGIQFNGYDYWNGNYPNFTYDSFCLMLQDPWGDFSEIKVIGNIIDNSKFSRE